MDYRLSFLEKTCSHLLKSYSIAFQLCEELFPIFCVFLILVNYLLLCFCQQEFQNFLIFVTFFDLLVCTEKYLK
jgi:hypothetical protein